MAVKRSIFLKKEIKYLISIFRKKRKLSKRERFLFLGFTTLLLLTIISISLSLALVLIGMKQGETIDDFLKKSRAKIGNILLFDPIPPVLKDFLTKVSIMRIKNGNLAVYNLILSQNDLDFFNDLTSRLEKADPYTAADIVEAENRYRDVRVEYDGDEAEAKMKLHGGSAHWKYPKKSYNLRFSKDKLLNKMEKIQFIVPEDRSYLTPIIFRDIAQVLELPYPENGFAMLLINNVSQGLYYYEEDIDNEETFFEKNQLPNDFSMHRIEGIIWDWDSRFWQTSGTNPTKTIYRQEALYRLKRLLDASENEEQEALEELVDFPKTAAFEALRSLKGSDSTHDFQSGNLKVIYSSDNGKFYFSPRIETGISDIPLERPRTIQTFEHSLTYYYPPTPLYLFHSLLRNNEFRHLRNQYLKRLISDDWIVEKYKKLKNEFMAYFLKDLYSNPSRLTIKAFIERDIENLKNNIALIRDNLSRSRVFITLTQRNNQLEIDLVPDSMAALEIKNFRIFLESKGSFLVETSFENGNKENNEKVNFYNTDEIELTPFYENQLLFANLNEELYAQRATFSLKIRDINGQSVKVKDVQIKIVNTFTDDLLLESKELFVETLEAGMDYELASQLPRNDFLEKYSELQWYVNNNQLTLMPQKYLITRDIIIPKGLEIIIPAGTRLEIDPGRNILSYSSVEIQGNSSLPVEIKASDFKNPFGAFAISGSENKACQTKINFLNISGGSETFLNGVFYNGALSIYYCDLEMNNSKIYQNQADDGLNVKFGNVLINNTLFQNNSFDNLDLDSCTGNIQNSTFEYLVKNENADGIDLSNSNLVIKDSFFKGAGDKGISVGEETKGLAVNNKIYDNNIGVAVKDSSQFVLFNNDFKRNEKAISVFQKKLMFNGGEVYLINNSIDNFSFDYDPLSAIFNSPVSNNLEDIIFEVQEIEKIDIIEEIEKIKSGSKKIIK